MNQTQHKNPCTHHDRKGKQKASSHSRLSRKSGTKTLSSSGSASAMNSSRSFGELDNQIKQVIDAACEKTKPLTRATFRKRIIDRCSQIIYTKQYDEWTAANFPWQTYTYYNCPCGITCAGCHRSKKCTPETQVLAYFNAMLIIEGDSDSLYHESSTDYGSSTDLSTFELNLTSDSIVDKRTVVTSTLIDHKVKNSDNNIEVALPIVQPCSTTNKFNTLVDELDAIADGGLTNIIYNVGIAPTITNNERETRPATGSDFTAQAVVSLNANELCYDKSFKTIGVELPFDLENIVSNLKEPTNHKLKKVQDEKCASNEDLIIYKPNLWKRLTTTKSKFDKKAVVNHKLGQLLKRKDQHKAGIEVISDEMIIMELYLHLRRNEFDRYKDRAEKLAHMTKLAVKFDFIPKDAEDVNKYFATIQKVTDSKDTSFMLAEVDPSHSRSRLSAWWGRVWTSKHFH